MAVREITYTRPFIYPYQKKILDSKARFTVCEASTKVGKTASHIIWLFEQPLVLDLKPGQKVWWIAPVFGQSEIAFNRMRNQVSDRNFFKANETKLKLTYPTGAEIHFKSAEKPDNLYGDDVYAFVFDEFTRAREASWHALRSTITATQARGKFIGNVRGKKNWGYRLAQKAKQGEENFEHFKITAYDAAAEGLLSFQEIEQAKKDLPEAVFKELYLAEPSEDGSNPFGIEHIARCVYPMSTNEAVCYGIDLAKKHDWTVITGLDKFGSVCYFDRFQKDWRQTKETILALPNKPICIDSTGVGDPIAEDIARVKEVEMVVYTGRQKQQLMEGLAYAIQNRQITILEGVMRDELESFEFEYTRTGVLYTAPSGMHDDAVNSLALARKIHGDAAMNSGGPSVW